MKKKQLLTILILLMILLIAASLFWIVSNSRSENDSQNIEESAAAEEDMNDSELGKAEEEAIANQEAEEAAIASHVYSYRGKAGKNENTFKAYDEAIADGSRYISMEVVVSSDNILYISSDENAYDKTGYNGMYEYIDSETIDGFTTEAGNKILKLSDVFDKYGGTVNYVIEIKPDSDKCIDAFKKIVDKYGLSDVITVQSRFTEVLKDLDKKYPEMPKLFVCWNQGDFNYAVDEPYVDIISVRADVETAIFTNSNCKAAHDADKLFGAWTLDTEEDIKNAIDMGVDNYFTNKTGLAISIEREYGLEARKNR